MFSQFMQQISGINLITYYAPVIFENSIGLDRNLSLLLSGFNGVAYFISALVPIPLIERVGRRKLLMFATAGQACTMAVLAGCTSVPGNTAAGIVAAVMLFVFNFFFAVGLLSIPWLYPAEISPLSVRAKSAGLATMTNWLFTFLVVMITYVMAPRVDPGPTLTPHAGPWRRARSGGSEFARASAPASSRADGCGTNRTYLVWMCTNAVFVPIIYFLYVETTGQTLEDLDMLFERETSWFIGPKSARLAKEIRQTRAMQRQEMVAHGADKLEREKAGSGMRALDEEHVEKSQTGKPRSTGSSN